MRLGRRHDLLLVLRLDALDKRALVGLARNNRRRAVLALRRRVLERAGWQVGDLDVIESNEAFAAQALAVMDTVGLDPAIVNPMGGAIALGHPLGATGAIRAATVVHALHRQQLKYGMLTMCVGMGQGAAGVFERV